MPVAAHHLRAAQADFTDAVEREFLAVIVADADFGRRQGETDGAAERDAHQGIDADGGGRFGQAPSLGDLATRGLLPALGDRALHRHAATHCRDEVGEIQIAEPGRIQQGIKQGVDAHEEHRRVAA